MFTKKYKKQLETIVESTKRIESKLMEMEQPKTSSVELRASTTLATLKAMCGNKSVESTIESATNYEFGLRIMKKQLEDQLIYIGGGDESQVSTIQFESIEALCNTMLGMINILLINN